RRHHRLRRGRRQPGDRQPGGRRYRGGLRRHDDRLARRRQRLGGPGRNRSAARTLVAVHLVVVVVLVRLFLVVALVVLVTVVGEFLLVLVVFLEGPDVLVLLVIDDALWGGCNPCRFELGFVDTCTAHIDFPGPHSKHAYYWTCQLSEHALLWAARFVPTCYTVYARKACRRPWSARPSIAGPCRPHQRARYRGW